MFKKITNSFFGNPKGVIVDNSYDPYVLHQLIKYFTENKIEYLSSQDIDLSYLKHFKDVSFLSIPNEATNFDELNSLKNLTGLCLYTSSLKNIHSNVLEKIVYLEIIYDENIQVDFSQFKALKYLRINSLKCSEIIITNDLETIEFNYCKKISNLDFLKNIKTIKRIKLDYLPKLENISYLIELSQTLEELDIWDCTKIRDLESTLSTLIQIKNLTINTLELNSKMHLKNLVFLKDLGNLETFATNYKIKDGDLNNLLVLKDANITRFYKNYNLKDKDLPHIDVLINDNGDVKRVELESLALGKEDLRIIWLN